MKFEMYKTASYYWEEENQTELHEKQNSTCIHQDHTLYSKSC